MTARPMTWATTAHRQWGQVPMVRELALVSIAVLLLLLAHSVPALGEEPPSAGAWSTRAVSLAYSGATSRVAVPGANSQLQVVVEGNGIQVVRAGKPLMGTQKVGIGRLSEILWAPNSRAFLVTESDGGIVGTWRVRLFLVEATRVNRKSLDGDVVRRFKSQFRCREPEEPNVGAIAWSDDSRSVLLVAEVPPHSSCPEMGKVRGFRVSVPNGRILEELADEVLKTQWAAFLGDRLRSFKGLPK